MLSNFVFNSIIFMLIYLFIIPFSTNLFAENGVTYCLPKPICLKAGAMIEDLTSNGFTTS